MKDKELFARFKEERENTRLNDLGMNSPFLKELKRASPADRHNTTPRSQSIPVKKNS
jgi:hypothetical protein